MKTFCLFPENSDRIRYRSNTLSNEIRCWRVARLTIVRIFSKYLLTIKPKEYFIDMGSDRGG